ncbi:TM0106 family RecB-like putative nuclease [Compostimonas suwonensis]|uniref:AAA+ ATPase domain-containing protein n=1 Tax=Compostimonas suwonensis TaxID=1048394 RepID=A0A2M9BYI0_9MICO|nr:bifunctional RecB family nuclease/DEAD/DEAH box helicase [Compostimonas suwonensis]PJJ63116.1 uncharacterized protein CLV54_0772 [Compostimonas suwonensis]
MILLGTDTGPAVVYSASDLVAASRCEWAVVRRLDARLGRIEQPPTAEDDMLARTGALGDAHERRMLERLRETCDVVEIERPQLDEITTATEATTAALAEGAGVVFQGAFFDGRFLGYADFLIRGGDGRYEVYDTKLARSAKITALLQLAAYAEQLQALGVPTGEQVHLVLGDGRTSTHRLRDILPVYRRRRARLERILDERLADDAASEWGDPRYTACGRCEVCEEQVQLHRDVLLVAGLSLVQRAKLRAAGIMTIEQLAGAAPRAPSDAASSLTPVAVPGMAAATFAALSEQARLQIAPVDARHPLAWAVVSPRALSALPAPDEGDIFFDFEGDPLYQQGESWGLDYLFGLVDARGRFRAFWAHDLAEERQALIDFLAYLAERRARFPAMHVYHYASYERTHLLTLAARHGVGEEAVDDLLRNHVLVDLYPIVRQGLRIGSRSYSLKKLEPLYMGSQLRSGVANAADSITEYVRSRELLAQGDADAAASVLAQIADYNAYDCLSTLRLRDWLFERAAENAVSLAGADELTLPVPIAEPDPVYLALTAQLAAVPPGERTADQTALALASAAIDYHRREGKSFWWDHFARLRDPIEEWADTRDVFVIDRAEVLRDWAVEPGKRTASRVLRVEGTAAPGSSFGAGASPFVLYDPPFPPIEQNSEPGARRAHDRATLVQDDDGNWLLTERLKRDAAPYDQHPVAVTPGKPPPAGSQIGAIGEWGRRVLDALPGMLPDAALDILRREPPRGGLVAVGSSVGDAIRDSLLRIDHSYLAVQGPPGTGKTYTGSRVIAELVNDHGWKVGVVAQSHATVENMLEAIVDAGVDARSVGKKPKDGDTRTRPWQRLDGAGTAGFLARPGGRVIGGTAWTFSNAGTVPRESLDLLVIDEAGQFSLAATIAAAVSARRLLLLGDPQQLPQVSQGTHPEPVDVSALGWLSHGHDVLPAELGYFLETSWRMHPAVCEPVSQLSYEGALRSHPSDRRLDGVEPGLHTVPVPHVANSTSSIDEADAVVAIVAEVLGREWSSKGSTAPLGTDGVIVVAPYNAQVELIRSRLAAAGYGEVAVGTVDRFQGREAAIAIVSLAASSAAEVPRGIEFLLLANRLNVAISRAQWAAYLVYSPFLTDYLPTSIGALAQLSAFLRLVEGGEGGGAGGGEVGPGG